MICCVILQATDTETDILLKNTISTITILDRSTDKKKLNSECNSWRQSSALKLTIPVTVAQISNDYENKFYK